MKLLDAETDAGNGASFGIRQWGNRELDHLYTFFVWGTFDGAAVTLEISPDDTNWFAVPDVSVTAAGVTNVEFRAPYVRAVVTGGTTRSLSAMLL